jgi:hypothetical protein
MAFDVGELVQIFDFRTSQSIIKTYGRFILLTLSSRFWGQLCRAVLALGKGFGKDFDAVSDPRCRIEL